MDLLKRHLFPISTYFERSLVLAFAVDPEAVEGFLPPGLTLDYYDNPKTGKRNAFMVIALVQTRDLRLTGLPASVGGRFFLTGYRLFVRRRHTDGRLLRGLFVLRSDTDKRLMATGGNLFARYNYHLGKINTEVTPEQFSISVKSDDGVTDLEVTADLTSIPADLPEHSPFARPEDSRRFVGPLPWTFDHEKSTDSLMMVRGHRADWNPQRVAVDIKTCNFLNSPGIKDANPVLANAFYVHDVAYRWDRGIRVPAILENSDDTSGEAVDE